MRMLRQLLLPLPRAQRAAPHTHLARSLGLCPAAQAAVWPPLGTGGGGVGSVRHLHKGHVYKTLEKLNMPRHQWLKEVDQAPERSSIRRHKEKYLREIRDVYDDLSGLFGEKQKKAVVEMNDEEKDQQKESRQRREDTNQALRIYRLLRPDAPPFFEEDAANHLRVKANRALHGEKGTDLVDQASGVADRLEDGYLPAVNQRAFLLALESVVASLADDIETLLNLTGIEPEVAPDHPLRLKILLDQLFNAFPLEKDPSKVDNFMQACWPRLKGLLPKEIGALPEDDVADWLRGHLQRVRANQRRAAAKIFLHQGEDWQKRTLYSFAEDFPYDDDPLPGVLADERNLDFPLEQASNYMQSLLGALSQSPAAASLFGQEEAEAGAEAEAEAEAEDAGSIEVVSSDFQDLVWDLERIGLRNWLRMDVEDIEKFIPKGHLPELSIGGGGAGGEGAGGNIISLSAEDVKAAKLMLRCAARDKANLLDFEAVDPHKLLHGLPGREIAEELEELPVRSQLKDATLEALVEDHQTRLAGTEAKWGATLRESQQEEWLGQGVSIQHLYQRELDIYRTSGPVEWRENEGVYQWQWRQPANTFWDERRKVYIQEQKGVDPLLQLKEMRQHLLDIKRMSSMVKVGRINYYRAIVVVGNGRGVYGFGVGFGNTTKEARADAALKGLQNLDYIDMDPGQMLCTPTRGIEYKHVCTIIPRPIGRGIAANKKFLPLLYILGLNNCRVKFMHQKWFTRIRAIKRALDQIVSRRTLANMTGQRYALLVAPGDHWVHWPDRWFEEVKESYNKKHRWVKMMRRHALHFKKRSGTFTPGELKPGWTSERYRNWSTPLERWLQKRREPASRKATNNSTPNRSAVTMET